MPLLFARTLATLVLLALPALGHAQAAHLPWSPTDKPPAIARVKLGASMADVVRTLGEPEAADTLDAGTVSLTWFKKGISATITQHDGVAIVSATKREAAELGGIRVGDTHEMVRAKLGEPTRQQGPTWLYEVGSWAIAVQFHAQRDAVVRLGVGVAGRAQ